MDLHHIVDGMSPRQSLINNNKIDHQSKDVAKLIPLEPHPCMRLNWISPITAALPHSWRNNFQNYASMLPFSTIPQSHRGSQANISSLTPPLEDSQLRKVSCDSVVRERKKTTREFHLPVSPLRKPNNFTHEIKDYGQVTGKARLNPHRIPARATVSANPIPLSLAAVYRPPPRTDKVATASGRPPTPTNHTSTTPVHFASDSDESSDYLPSTNAAELRSTKQKAKIPAQSLSEHILILETKGSQRTQLSMRSRQYVCQDCGRSFFRKSDLVRHIQIHLGIKPNVCQICGKQFIQRSALTVHHRVHTGEKPYSCSICHRAFGDSSSLARHRRIHLRDSEKEVNNHSQLQSNTSAATAG